MSCSGDPAFKFFFGMALVLEGQVQEGIRELDSVQTYTEVQLGALLALIYAHKRCSTVDREAVVALDTRLKEAGDCIQEFNSDQGSYAIVTSARGSAT